MGTVLVWAGGRQMGKTLSPESRRNIVERVERFLAGDRMAFDGALYLALYSRGERILSAWIVSPHIRSDILQDAIFRFWNALETGRFKAERPEKGPAYYDSIVRHLRADYAEKLGVDPIRLEADTLDLAGQVGLTGVSLDGDQDQASPADRTIRQELRQQVHQCMRKLPDDLRQLTELYFFGGLSLRKLAVVVGTKTSSVRTSLDKAKNRIAVCLAKAGIDLSCD